MIAQRFKALGWVAVVASAATGLYLVSLQVAAERGKVEAVERQIAATQREMRQLQTELGTRGSMRQLEKWNADVLALSAPKAAQFARDGAQLVALNLDDAGKTPNAPPATTMAAANAKPPVPVEPVAPQPANFVKPPESAPPKIQTIAMMQPVSARDVQRIGQRIGAKVTATESRKRP